MRLGELFELVRDRLSEDRGGVLVTTAVSLALLIGVTILVVDVGHWFQHKRHLQLQADAGALAGAGLFNNCLGDAPTGNADITAMALKYAGDPDTADSYNRQVPTGAVGSVSALLNSKTYANGRGPDDTVELPPCDAKMVDVKMTEEDVPWFFHLASVFGAGLVPAINAHARVEIREVTSRTGALPIGVPDVNPQVGRAYFVDETTGTTITSVPLSKLPDPVGGLQVWDNAQSRDGVASLPVSVPITSSKIGVVVALGGATSTTCGDLLVDCYDAVTSTAGTVTYHPGLRFVRGYDNTAVASVNAPPQARDVSLFTASCPNEYFSYLTATSPACNVGVHAKVDFVVATNPATDPQITALMTATVNGATKPLTYNAGTGYWDSAAADSFGLPVGAGPLDVELQWERQGSAPVAGQSCSTSGGNKCKGTFGIVQRSFTGVDAHSGPLHAVELLEGGAPATGSYERCTTTSPPSPSTCVHQFVVRIGVAGNLGVGRDSTNPVVYLRVTGGSLNQSLDCDPDVPNLRAELSGGCAPTYTKNAGTACPSSPTSLWGTTQPWPCVAVQTGGAVGQVGQGMSDRILGPGGSTCTAPNNWPTITPGDPRIVPVFLTPFGSFSGSGSTTVPVTGFGTFYVSGWGGSGGTSDPCPGSDPVPDKGYIAGHFFTYIDSLNTSGGGTTLCDLDAFGTCVAVMTR